MGKVIERGYASPRNEWQLQQKKARLQQLIAKGVLTLSATTNPGVNDVYFAASGAADISTQGGLSPYTPERDATACVLYLDAQDPGTITIATTSVANGSDFSNASWTKTNCSVSANSTMAPDGTNNADTITTSAGASPRVSSALTNENFNITKMQPETFTLYVKAAPSGFNWVCIETSNVLGDGTHTANQAFFDCANGVTGFIGAGLSGASITAAANGYYKLVVTMNSGASGTSAGSFRIRPSTANTTVTDPANGSFMILWGAAVVQPRVAAIENKVSAAVIAQAAAANQPGYEASWQSGHGAVCGYGQATFLTGSEAAVINALGGTQPAYTYIRSGQYRDTSSTPREFSVCNGTNDTAGHFFGLNSAKNQANRDPDGATSTSSVASAASVDTNAHTTVWHTAGGAGNNTKLSTDGGANDPDALLNVAAMTPTRWGILTNVRLTVGGYALMALGKVTLHSADLSSNEITEISRYVAGSAGLTA